MKLTQRFSQKNGNTTEVCPKSFDSTEFEEEFGHDNFENEFSSAEQVFGFDNVEEKFEQEFKEDSHKVDECAFDKSFKVKGSCKPCRPNSCRPYGPNCCRPCGPNSCRPCGPNSCRPCGPNSYRPFGPNSCRPCGTNFSKQSGRRDPRAVSFVMKFGATSFVQEFGPVAFVQQFGPKSFVRNFGFRSFVQQFGVRTASEVFGFNAEQDFVLNGFEDKQNGPTTFEDQYGPNVFEEQYGPNDFEEQFGPNVFDEQYEPNFFDEQFLPNSLEQYGRKGPNSSQFVPISQRNGNAQQCFVLFARFEAEAEKSRTPQELSRTFQRNSNGCVAIGRFVDSKTSVNQKAQIVEILQGVCRMAAQSCYSIEASQYMRKCQAAARLFQGQGTMTPTWVLACQMASDPQCSRNGQFSSQVTQVMRRAVQEVAARAVAQTVVACEENDNQTGAVAVAQNAGALYFFFTTSNNESVKEDFLRKTQGALRVVVQQCNNNFPGNFKRGGFLKRSIDQAEAANACRACADASPSTLSELFSQ